MTNPTTEARDALLPCPFCGGEARYCASQCAEDAMACWVQCSCCQATTETFEDAYAPRAEAIAAWNTRTPTPLPAADSGWRDIASAPRDGTEVLVSVRPKVIRLGWYFRRSSRTEGWCDENGTSIKPTHWMPLPTAPERAS